MPWKKQISSGKWLLNNNNQNDDESLHNLISPNNNNVSSSSNDSSNNDHNVDVLSSNMQMMSLSSPGMITNIIHGVKPSTVAVVCDNNDSLMLDAEIVTEEEKGCATKNISNNKEMRIIRRVSLSNSSSSSSSMSSSSNESTTAIIYETIDDIICRIENKDLVNSYKVAYQIQKNTEKQQQQQLDEDGIEEDDDSHYSGELTRSCSSGSIEQECSSSKGVVVIDQHSNALNKFLSSPSPTNWESLVSSLKHRSQSPWGDGEFAVINVLDNGEEEGSVVVSDFDDSIEGNKYAFINKYLTQKTDASDASGGLESSTVMREVEPPSTVAREEEPPLETAADSENDETQEAVGVEAAVSESAPNNIDDDAQVVGVEAATNNETVDSSPSIDGEEGIYKKLSKRNMIYQSISMCKTKMKSLTQHCRGYKKGSYSTLPTLDIKAGGFSNNSSIKRVQVPPSVTIIDECAYELCPNLKEVVLNDGIQEIKCGAFNRCQKLEHINIPSTVKSIGFEAFAYTGISSIELPESIHSISEGCFLKCHLTKVRIPSLVKDLPRRGFDSNSFMFSVELPENIKLVDISCFYGCDSLRNIVFPSSATTSFAGTSTSTDDDLWYLIMHCKDLRQVYESTPPQFKLQPMKKALMNRFDGLPIHEILYYQSYHPLETVLERLDEAMNQRKTNRVLSATYQGLLGVDWLGMTPLHILACSKRQSLELYRVIIERYPQNLITKDKFGAEPILYAIWGSTPKEILDYLAESLKSKHPDYELDWYGMVRTLAKAPSTRVLHKLFDIQYTYFPDQKIRRWKSLTNEIASDSVSIEVFRFIFRRIISSRLDRIGLKRMMCIYDQIDAFPDDVVESGIYFDDMRERYLGVGACLSPIYTSLDIYEHDYQVLKEVAPLLELVVWKIKVDNKGASTSLSRRVCRYNCGADVVIGHVLPFLVRGDLWCVDSMAVEL